MTFRRRIIVAMMPLFVLLLALGGTAVLLIRHLGNHIAPILRENYRSVLYLRDLNEALAGIDSAFQSALAGSEKEAFRQYEDHWKLYQTSLTKEQNNITLPGEEELVEKLTKLSQDYRHRGGEYFAGPNQNRNQLYFGQWNRLGLYGMFRDITSVSRDIVQLNQDNMEIAARTAHRLAHSSLLWYGGGLAAGIGLAMLLAVSIMRTIVQPVRAVTESALAIGAGNLDQLVPVTSNDELGQLASAFNAMIRQLRGFRQSHQAELIRAQQTSQATIASFPDPVLVIDPQRQVEMANPVARRLLGVRTPDEGNVGPLVWEPPDALRQPLADALANQREYLPDGFDKAIALQVGEQTRSYLPRVLPIRDPAGTTLGAAVLLEDITRFRLLDEIKSNLVATVSHELKTPLTGIRLVIHLLLEENVGPLTPKQLDLLVDARDNAERLLTMTNNLLDLARLEQGCSQLRLQPEQPAKLLQAAADAFRAQAVDKGIELVLGDVPDLPLVAADADQFQHAMANLLDNAIAHTPQGGRITLAAAPAEGAVVFSVTDTGCGIPAEYLSLVFQKYFRVPGQTAAGGSGLGLAIVREIVTAHGGSVSCESQPGKETVFRVWLPVYNG